MNAAEAEILLLAPALLGESLALRLTASDPELVVRLRDDDLVSHPRLVIWSVGRIEHLALFDQELRRLREHWQPSPLLLLLPASLPINTESLLSLDCEGLLQDPDTATLRAAIATLLDGGRCVRLHRDNGQTPEPRPAMGVGQWLLTSGLQQISNDLQLIEALLTPPPENLMLRLLLEGRARELGSARNLLLLLWGPLQVGLADAQPLGPTQPSAFVDGIDTTHPGSTTAITVRQRNAAAVWASIEQRIAEAVGSGLGNATGQMLAIEGLHPERRRDLLLALLQQMSALVTRLRSPSTDTDPQLTRPLEDQWLALQPQVRRQAVQSMAGNYVRLPRGEELQLVAEQLLSETDLDQGDEELPNPQRMLAPLLLDQPVLVDGQLLPSDHPRALLQLEALVTNWLVRNAELITSELLGLCGEWPELRRYLLEERLIPTRELERMRNQLNNQSRWQLWIERPVRLYESQRLLYQLRSGRIEPLVLIEPRDQELRQLGWWQQQVALLLEARDAIAPQMQSLIRRIGDLMVVLLTRIIGRSIGLIGRGVAQGMGRPVRR